MTQVACIMMQRYVLSTISMSSEVVIVTSTRREPLLRFSGDFSGEEKTPSSGSIPCSSRKPVSFSVIPVFLIATISFNPCVRVAMVWGQQTFP